MIDNKVVDVEKIECRGKNLVGDPFFPEDKREEVLVMTFRDGDTYAKCFYSEKDENGIFHCNPTRIKNKERVNDLPLCYWNSKD